MATLPKYPNEPSEKEISEFLSKVDEIENVIKGMSSEDVNKSQNYMTKADELIAKVSKKDSKKDNEDEDEYTSQTRTGFSKTSINKDAYKNQPPQAPLLPESADKNAFMAAMEADAKERSERRKEREKVAAEYKEQGNTEFNQGNYQKALEFYDKAINQVRDNTVLYTNRAQTKVKLGLYKETLTDCDWALRIWPNCLKAYVNKGHAYLGLKEYDKARDSYKQILIIDNKKENIVKDYLTEVDRREQASKEESKAAHLFEEGNHAAKNVVDLLTSINKKDQLPLYYAGGFRVITSCLDGTEAQSLFRTNNGLQIPVTHDALKWCVSSNFISLSREERDMLTAALDMFTAACKDNETSQQQLLGLPQFPSQLLAMLEVKFKGQGRLLKTSCLNLLHEVSLTPAGRVAIVGKFDTGRLVTVLFHLMVRKSTYANTAAALLNNIALDKRLKSLLKGNIQDEILPVFENMLNNKISPSIAGLASSAATNLAADITVRKKMASRPTIWKNIANLLISYTNSRFCTPLEQLLGLLINLSTGVDSMPFQNVILDVTVACYTIMTSKGLSDLAVARSIAVLGNIIPHSEYAAAYLCENDRPMAFLDFMRNGDSLYYKPALKCMTKLTQNREVARNIVDSKGTSVLLNFLNNEDEVTIGNAALCLAHLCQVDRFCTKLTKTNVIQKLLILARDGRKPAVQSNCAILIGKLVQGDSRHLDRLRELHGIEILHGCMKHVI